MISRAKHRLWSVALLVLSALSALSIFHNIRGAVRDVLGGSNVIVALAGNELVDSIWFYIAILLFILFIYSVFSRKVTSRLDRYIGKRSFLIVLFFAFLVTAYLKTSIAFLARTIVDLKGQELSDAERLFGILHTEAEIVGILVTFYFAIVAATWALYEYTTQRRKRERTARFWVIYNTLNRINQDIQTYKNLKPHLATLAEMELSASQGWNKNDESPEKATIERMQLKIVTILKAFRSTWGNDDVLSESIAFEFNLLEQAEKAAILKCFSEYNDLQDEISFTLNFMDVYQEDLRESRFPADELSILGLEKLNKINATIYDRVRAAEQLVLTITGHDYDYELITAEQIEVLRSKVATMDEDLGPADGDVR